MRILPFSHLVVKGTSMLPSYSPGDHVISLNWFKKVSTGDVVVVFIENKIILKRITKIKDEKLFVEGDNHNQSWDSRDFGWIDKKNVIGKVI